jgi:hypothetical protein
MFCFLPNITHAHLAIAFALAVFSMPGTVFWLYFSGTLLLLIGLVKVSKGELPQMRGLEKIMPFGRLFLAIPLGVFGTEQIGGHREHRSALDAGTHILGISGGHRIDCGSSEYHGQDTIAFGGNITGNYALFLRGQRSCPGSGRCFTSENNVIACGTDESGELRIGNRAARRNDPCVFNH